MPYLAYPKNPERLDGSSPLLRMSPEQILIWEAAIMDGEGAIGLQGRLRETGRMYMTPVVQVGNIFEPLCLHFRDTYGGRIWINRDDRTNRRTMYHWSVAGGKALAILRAVYPYLWIKKRQADLVFEFYDGKLNPPRITAEELARRIDIYARMRKVNQRGTGVREIA